MGASCFLPASHRLVHCLYYKQSDSRSKSDWAISLPAITSALSLIIGSGHDYIVFTDAANEILGKERCKKKPLVIRDILDLGSKEEAV